MKYKNNTPWHFALVPQPMSVFTGSIGNNPFKTPSGQRWALKCLSRISSDLQIRLAVKSRLILVTWNSFHVPIWRTLTNPYEMADQRLCWMHLTDEKKLNFLNIHILSAMLILFHLHNTELCFYLKLVSLLRLCHQDVDSWAWRRYTIWQCLAVFVHAILVVLLL